MGKADSNIIVVTDLDGSLLDHFSYSWEPAVPAINLLKRRRIPLIFCTSKTRAELVYLQDRMGIDSPFISETGGAIWFRPEVVKTQPPGARSLAGMYAFVLGRSYRELRSALVGYREKHDLDMTGFGDLEADRVAELCNVPLDVAELVLQRDFDEPFFFNTPPPPGILEKMHRDFARQQMRIIQGGRFYHLVGQSDKGRGIKRLREWYQESLEQPVTIIGLGDSPNDIALFEASDIPVLIKRHDGKYHPLVREKSKTRLAGEIGPVGWNRAILKLLG